MALKLQSQTLAALKRAVKPLTLMFSVAGHEASRRTPLDLGRLLFGVYDVAAKVLKDCIPRLQTCPGLMRAWVGTMRPRPPGP